MATQYMSDDESIADLADRIPGVDRAIYKDFKALAIQAAFDDRIFVLFKPTGLNERNEHRDPEILTSIRVINFRLNSTDASIRIMDENNGESMDLDYVPRRVFGYDVFMSIPPRMQLRWDARIIDCVVRRSLSYPILIKTKNRPDWYSAGVTYACTPNEFRRLYPQVDINFY